MKPRATERRLAAVLSADAAGYTRLMAANDVQALETMKALRTLINGVVREFSGRLVDAVGDNAMAEFASAVDALGCALEIQRQVAAFNTDRPADERMEFRIGIHVGELVADGERIGGDGVNIAARVRPLAAPGQVVVTSTVLDMVAGKIDLPVIDLGTPTLKNVARPVQAFAIDALAADAPAAAATAAGESLDSVPGFSGRHAIAVLPFQNLSDDAEQEYFADGLAADLISRLSALRLYPVIARNSSFAFRNHNVDAREIGESLGAHYLVSGTVRRAGNQVRIVVEVIDAHNSHQLWSDRFDRELSDIFELQDEITELIVGSLGPVLSRSEIRHAMERTPADLDAWDCVNRGIWHLFQATGEDNEQARHWARRAIELQPRSASAYALLAFSHQYDLIYRWSDSQAESSRLSREMAEKAVALDHDDPVALTALGYAYNLSGEQQRAISTLEKAIELNPSSALSYWALGSAMALADRPDEGIRMLQKAIRLSPRDPLLPEFLFSMASAHFCAGRYQQAVDYARRSLDERDNQPGAYRVLAASLAHLDQAEPAREALAQLQRIVPSLSAQYLQAFLPDAVVERYLAGFRRIGWDG